MNKPILIEIIACLVLGTILGIAFWLFDGGRTRKKASECPGGVSGAQIKPIKIYDGQWIEDIKQVGSYWSVGYVRRETIK